MDNSEIIRQLLEEMRTKIKNLEKNNTIQIQDIKLRQEYLENARRELENFKRDIPAHVAKEMNGQVTNYLNNHVAMQDILSHHAGRLNKDLYAVSENILDKIVKEDRYHILWNKLESEARDKVEKMIEEKKKVWVEQMQMHEARFNKMLAEHKARIEEELEKITEVNKKIDELYDYSDSLQTQNYVLATISVISLSVAVFSFFNNR